MAANPKQKLKLLYLYRMLEQETDSTHGLSMAQILERLAKEGIEAERKGIYRDLGVLREFGLQIGTIQRMPVEYTLVKSGLTLDELMLLADATRSSKFLTQRTSNRLVRKLSDLASTHERVALEGRVHVEGRVKSQNDSIFHNVDTIHEALRLRRKLSFLYYKYDARMRRQAQHGGEPYVHTPVKIVYADGLYYLITWSDNHEDFVRFRIDRMRLVQVSDEPATRNAQIANYAFEDFACQSFGMFDGPVEVATLEVAPGAMDIIADRFGRNVKPRARADGSAQVDVKVRVSSQFFGWVAGMGGAVRLVGPTSLAEQYHSWLRNLADET